MEKYSSTHETYSDWLEQREQYREILFGDKPDSLASLALRTVTGGKIYPPENANRQQVRDGVKAVLEYHNQQADIRNQDTASAEDSAQEQDLALFAITSPDYMKRAVGYTAFILSGWQRVLARRGRPLL